MTVSSSLPHAVERLRPALPGIRRQRRQWDRRAASWDGGGAQRLGAVVDAVLEAAAVGAGETAVDLGAGTGQLSLPLAGVGADVTAIDVSPAMLARLRQRAAAAGLDTARLTTIEAAIEHVALPPASVDVVISNYAMHHLRHDAKAAAVTAAASWLRPGGRLVIGDMMFSRGASARDRRIIRGKVAVLARRGPGGWWRIAKNAFRFTAGISERPAPVESWTRWLRSAGFVDVHAEPVVAEAVVVVGTKPAQPG